MFGRVRRACCPMWPKLEIPSSTTACRRHGGVLTSALPTAALLFEFNSAARLIGNPSAAETVRIVVVLPTEPVTATMRIRRASVQRYIRATRSAMGHSQVV